MSSVISKFEELKNLYVERFGQKPLKVKAPGRINIIGEHTDYNDGFVLPAAIDKSVKLVIQKNNTSTCTLVAIDLKEEHSFSINDDLIPVDKQWANYFLGVIDEIKKRNHSLAGFDLMFTSNIPIGAGLSSSAAIESAFGYALDHLFNLGISRMDLALIGQQAEHTFAGVKCGIMDQFASMMGKKNMVVQLDCRSLDYTYFPADFSDYSLVLFDTQVSHNLADSEYNIRRKQCETGLAALKEFNNEVNSLRDATLLDLDKAKNQLEPVVYNRCKYIIEENDRVLDLCDALNSQDIETVGKLMFETHDGLSSLYEVSCPELDELIKLVKNDEDVIGARMMGGGFGGCTLNLIKKSQVEQVINNVKSGYQASQDKEIAVYNVFISDGTKKIE